MNRKTPTTDDWAKYEEGKEYNSSLDLYNKVAVNERFYRGEQWEGINSNGLPKPVFNLFQRIINFYSSSILSSAVAMRYSFADLSVKGLKFRKILPTNAKDFSTASRKDNGRSFRWTLSWITLCVMPQYPSTQ